MPSAYPQPRVTWRPVSKFADDSLTGLSGYELRAELTDVDQPLFVMTDRQLTFEAIGSGRSGGPDVRYRFQLNFLHLVDAESSYYNIRDDGVIFYIVLANSADVLDATTDAPTLLTANDASKADWLFSLATPHRVAASSNRKSGTAFSYPSWSFRQHFMLAHNLLMFGASASLASSSLVRLDNRPDDGVSTHYATLGHFVKLFHLFMFLELTYPLFKYTSGPLWSAALRVLGRNMAILIIEVEPRLQTKPVVCYLTICYAISDTIRYASHAWPRQPFLLWLRQTVWIVAVPVSAILEAVMLWLAIVYFDETGRLTLPLSSLGSVPFTAWLRLYLLVMFCPTLCWAMQRLYAKRCEALGIKPYKRRHFFAPIWHWAKRWIRRMANDCNKSHMD